LRQRSVCATDRSEQLRVHLSHIRVVRIGDDRRTECRFCLDPLSAHEIEVGTRTGTFGSTVRQAIGADQRLVGERVHFGGILIGIAGQERIGIGEANLCAGVRGISPCGGGEQIHRPAQ